MQACLDMARQHAGNKLNLQKDCPMLFNELQTQRLQTVFEPPLSAEVSLAQLDLIADSRHGLRESSALSQDGLDRLLAELLETDIKDPEAEWRQAFLKWLDSLKMDDYEAEYQWLLRWLKSIKPSEQTVLSFIYGSIALLVIASAWLVISELYFAGFFVFAAGKRQALHKPDHQSLLYSSAARPVFSELSPPQQIAFLLEQVIDALAERKLIPRDASLTHRQMVYCLGQQAAGSETAFALLVRTAEPVLYGNRPVDFKLLSDYRRNAEALLDNAVL